MKLEEIIQNEKNQILVPSVTLRRGERLLVLLGMLHVATQHFFKIILSRLETCENAGFLVLYEEVEGIPSAEKSKLDMLFKGLQKYNLYSQLDCILPRSSWKSADCVDQLIENDTGAGVAQDEGNDEDMNDPKKYICNILLPQLENPIQNIPNFEVVINQRNQFAVNIILSYVEKNNVVSFWGCAHLPGMINLLEQAGFKLENIEWNKALDVGELKKLLKI